MVFWSCYFFDWKKRKEGCGFKALSMKLLLLLTCVCVRVVGGMLFNTISLSFAAVTSCNLCRQGIHLSCKEVFLASATSVLFNIRYIRISIYMYREISSLFQRTYSAFPLCQLSVLSPIAFFVEELLLQRQLLCDMIRLISIRLIILLLYWVSHSHNNKYF